MPQPPRPSAAVLVDIFFLPHTQEKNGVNFARIISKEAPEPWRIKGHCNPLNPDMNGGWGGNSENKNKNRSDCYFKEPKGNVRTCLSKRSEIKSSNGCFSGSCYSGFSNCFQKEDQIWFRISVWWYISLKDSMGKLKIPKIQNISYKYLCILPFKTTCHSNWRERFQQVVCHHFMP